MNRENPFRGQGIALVTPFTPSGSVDFEALEQLAEEQIQAGADFLCVLGTTAETPCLEAAEKKAIVETIVRLNARRVPILLGAGGNHTARVAESVSTDCPDGIDGVLIVTPYYNKPSQEGLYRHFKAVSEASRLPVVLYNVPGRTGVNLTAQTTLRIASECPNVVAVKEASGNIAQAEEIIRHAPDGFEVLSGDDAITFQLLTLGAKGVISVIGNAYPAQFGTLVHAALEGDYDRALRIHRRLFPAYRLLSADGNPSGIKSLLSVQGKIAANVLRLPLVPATAETQEALRAFDEEVRL